LLASLTTQCGAVDNVGNLLAQKSYAPQKGHGFFRSLQMVNQHCAKISAGQSVASDDSHPPLSNSAILVMLIVGAADPK